MYTDLINSQSDLETQEAVEYWLENLTDDHESVRISYHAPPWVDIDPTHVEFSRFLLDRVHITQQAEAFTVELRASFRHMVPVNDGRSNLDAIVASIVCKGTLSVGIEATTGELSVLVCPVTNGE